MQESVLSCKKNKTKNLYLYFQIAHKFSFMTDL